ncbi:P-type DNA transfer ATPase VirB11 [Paraburkholderia largidicola]|uniref:Type IV secretion system protein n=1 Tax=Paraburkholderia largidicola TaxID=3014751 RepID=A0A7I8C4K5_9BURK|nr:P-type DNA transfer ATPase VirB11 [Paraburkholderia sp. PGU16]BCF95419.1 P-type DNA transfer ATPase VirB11 [Paraburkholderia sp. PGU16]
MSDVLEPVEQIERYDNTITVRSLAERTGIAELMAREGVTEVAVNRPFEAWTESSDGWKRHELPSLTFDLCRKLANALAILNKKRGFGADRPMVPSRFPDGERGQLCVEPSVEAGTVVFTVRIPNERRLTMADYIRWGTFDEFRATAGYTVPPAGVELDPHQLQLLAALDARDIPLFLRLMVEHGLNVVYVGGTGSGKTTLMKATADMVPVETRIGTIEDTHELSLPLHPNKVHMFFSDTLPAKEVVKSTLRMKFDRVFLAELRGDETWDYLTLLNTGHEGGMTSVHANNSVAAFPRIATLIKQSETGQTMDYDYILREVKQTIDVVLFMNKQKKLTEVYYNPVEKWKMQRGLA